MTYSTISIPSEFPPSNRPIYITPVASMSRKNRDSAYPEVASAITRILSQHQGNKILIHTVSYELNSYIYKHCSKRFPQTYSYDVSGGKLGAIKNYLDNDGSILFAPSLERGIDLPNDSCRVIIVAKIPFPSLADKQISARLYSKGGQTWYNVKTTRSLVQMTGRGMRSTTDYCESYILDRQFIDLVYRKSKHLLPQWWKDALVWDKGAI